MSRATETVKINHRPPTKKLPTTRERDKHDEPSPDDAPDLWCSVAGELMLVAGETSGGAPYGITVAEFRRIGLSRQGFCANVELTPDPQARSDVYVALIPTGDDPDYRAGAVREARALRWLDGRLTNVRAPKVVALIEAEGDPILVETFVGGVEVDLRAGRRAPAR